MYEFVKMSSNVLKLQSIHDFYTENYMGHNSNKM